MDKADVFNFEIGLPRLPFGHPGQMHLIELPTKLGKLRLTKSVNFDLIGAREKNSEHGDPTARSHDGHIGAPNRARKILRGLDPIVKIGLNLELKWLSR